VRDHVLAADDAVEFVAKSMDLFRFLLPRYEAEGKAYLTIGIGCTGGRHRSVALANEFARLLNAEGFNANVSHRDTPSSGE
jgi:UPF0042 nucleotide-binding protein